MTKRRAPHKQLISLALLCVFAFGFFIILFSETRIYPGVYIQGVPVGRLTITDAQSAIENAYPQSFPIVTIGSDSKISVSDLSPKIDFSGALKKAQNTGKDSNIFANTITLVKQFAGHKIDIPLDVTFDENRLADFYTGLESQIPNPPVEASVKITGKDVSVFKGSPGKRLNRQVLTTLLEKAVLENKTSFALPISEVDPTITEEAANNLAERASRFLGKTLIIKEDDITIRKSPQDLSSLLALHGYNDNEISTFTQEVSNIVNRNIQSPSFNATNGKVESFSAPQDGVELDIEAFKSDLTGALAELEQGDQKEVILNAQVHVSKAPGFSGSAQDYGIVELIGKGTSVFRGSIASRIYNVALAASRVDGTLVAPNETFSFNKTVGDISQLTGYKQAYVISNGKTVLGDGGGVCQVSTTLFRAVMNSGLPVVERRAHSYRVGYYEQDAPAGFDATVYSPTTDFKFVNNTGHYILIHTITDKKTPRLTFELYGTKDGRTVNITKPVISDVIAPPDDLYVDDPTLHTGKINQIEHKAFGAKSTFTYTVSKDGQQIYKKTFISVYQPWQAVFMRGVGI